PAPREPAPALHEPPPSAPREPSAPAPAEPALTAASQAPSPAPHAQEPSGLELDLSGSREGWNKHVEEYQVRDEAKLSAETKKPEFGPESSERGGTEHHTGMHFHEYSAAETAIGLRIDWDPQAGRPRKVTYNFTSAAAEVSSQATDRSFHQEPRLKGESAQSREKAYTKSGFERGHLAQREAGKVDPAIDAALGLKKPTGPEVERALDVLTNVAPMTPTLNKGNAWRSAETRTAQFALQEGYVTVEITPIYDAQPPRLSDGTPIPRQFRRIIKSGPTGNVLENLLFDNK
ncbi:MAG TPA: DNA/RNA non-specific endonuclease, partial [Kofleriaceae bacterium]